MTSPTGSPPPRGIADGVLQFLTSLGQRSEAELYLRIYRQLSRDEFALLVLSADVLEFGVSTVAEQLGQLRDLGLVPHLLIGGLDHPASHAVDYLTSALAEEELRGVVVVVDSNGGFDLPVLNEDEILVLSLREPSERVLEKVAARLLPRKLLFLRSQGGLGPHGDRPVKLAPGHLLPTSRSGIFAINLRSDSADLRAAEVLSDDEDGLLGCAEKILRGPMGQRPRATVSFTSPFSILRELFTVSGDGTLVKLGSALNTFDSYDEIDRPRLERLLRESFQREVTSAFWGRAPRAIHLECDYRGVALLEEGQGAAFLSKFAVLPIARGEGLGQDLWWSISRENPALYWRSRPTNPINAWYVNVADGVHRTGLWHVYWRGIEAEQLPALISDAVARPIDFE